MGIYFLNKAIFQLKYHIYFDNMVPPGSAIFQFSGFYIIKLDIILVSLNNVCYISFEFLIDELFRIRLEKYCADKD